MEIPRLVRQCLQQFRSLLDGSRDDKLDEEYGRFRIWTGNLAAHREGGSRSLEYRLRDSENLRTRVLSLLRDLLTELQDYSDVRTGDQSSLEAGPLELDFVDDDLGADDSIQDIHELVNLLYRFSMTLKNPAGDNRVRRAIMSRSAAFDPWFIPHVQSKYPMAQAWLAQRLGRAISSKRQYILYREEHGKKKHQGLDDEAPDEQATTVATSVPGINPPTLNAADLSRGEDDTESIYSMTSFAPTESDASVLRPPRLPEKGANGDPFDCPICNSIVHFTSEERWRRHVYEDVPPYVCTHEACSTANTQYTRRRDWQRHMSRNHFRVWKCSIGCGAHFDNVDDLMAHLVDDHKQPYTSSSLQRLAESCAEPMPPSKGLACPLCQKQELTLSSWFKHVGRHMEQLALFALPSHLLDDEQERQDEDQVSGGVAIETDSASESISNVSGEGTNRDGNDSTQVAEATIEDDSRVVSAQDSEAPPNVTTMERPRGSLQKVHGEVCETCLRSDDPSKWLKCESCDNVYHLYCLEPPLKQPPDYDWYCPRCLVGTNVHDSTKDKVYALLSISGKADSSMESNTDLSEMVEAGAGAGPPSGEQQTEQWQNYASAASATRCPDGVLGNVNASDSEYSPSQLKDLTREGQVVDAKAKAAGTHEVDPADFTQSQPEDDLLKTHEYHALGASTGLLSAEDDKKHKKTDASAAEDIVPSTPFQPPIQPPPTQDMPSLRRRAAAPGEHAVEAKWHGIEPERTSLQKSMEADKDAAHRTTTQKKLYSVDESSGAKLVADVNIPVKAGGDRYHKRRDSVERGGYRAVGVEQQQDRRSVGWSSYTNDTYNQLRDKSINDEDPYSYTDPTTMYRDTEPRWRGVRPRRGSVDGGGATSRERPVSVLDATFGQRQLAEDAGPSPSTRGMDRISGINAGASTNTARFAPTTSTTISRPMTSTEAWSMYNFEVHARQCQDCYDPYEVHKRGQNLCETGHSLASDVAVHAYYKDGEAYSCTERDSTPTRLELPHGYAQTTSLLRAMDKRFRIRRASPSVVMHDGTSSRRYHGDNPSVIIEPATSSRSRRSKNKSTRYSTVTTQDAMKNVTPPAPTTARPRSSSLDRGGNRSDEYIINVRDPNSGKRSERRGKIYEVDMARNQDARSPIGIRTPPAPITAKPRRSSLDRGGSRSDEYIINVRDPESGQRSEQRGRLYERDMTRKQDGVVRIGTRPDPTRARDSRYNTYNRSDTDIFIDPSSGETPEQRRVVYGRDPDQAREQRIIADYQRKEENDRARHEAARREFEMKEAATDRFRKEEGQQLREKIEQEYRQKKDEERVAYETFKLRQKDEERVAYETFKLREKEKKEEDERRVETLKRQEREEEEERKRKYEALTKDRDKAVATYGNLDPGAGKYF